MKDKEKKHKQDKKHKNEKNRRPPKCDKDKNKKNVKKSSKIEERPTGAGVVDRSRREKIPEKVEFYDPLKNENEGVNMLPTNNINIEKELPNEKGICSSNQILKQTTDLINNYNNNFLIPQKPLELTLQEKSNILPNLNNEEERENEKFLKSDSLKRKETRLSNKKEKKEIKIKRTPKDFGVGEYSSIKIQTKCVNGKLFHDVNIQTFDQRRGQFKDSQNLDIPIYGKSNFISMSRNSINQNYYQSLKAKVSKNLMLNKKDIVLAKIQHLRNAVDRINNRYIH